MLERALRASGAQIITVAMRRVSPATRGSLLDVLAAVDVQVFPTLQAVGRFGRRC